MSTTQTGPRPHVDAVPGRRRLIAAIVGVTAAFALGWPVFHALQEAVDSPRGPQPTVGVTPAP